MKRWLLTALFLAGTLAPAGARAGEITVLKNRLLVAFDLKVPAAQRKSIIEGMGGNVLGDLDLFGITLAEPKLKAPVLLRQQLSQHPLVFRVEYDFYTIWIDAEPAGVPGLGLAYRSILEYRRMLRTASQTEEPATEVQWGVRRVNAPAAWPVTQGAGVKVAIVDTGIDPNHPELSGNIAGGHNALDNEAPWHDDHSHGTHVAGIVAAALNGKAVVGVAPVARLYAVKVLNKDGGGTLFSILKGMMWCAQNGMQVANMSLGVQMGNPLFEYAVNMMVDNGVTLVAAAGNTSGSVTFPAAYEKAIAVSALCPEQGVDNPKLCSDRAIANFSSRGPEVDFIAPGVKIPSTVIGGGVAAYSGTSMACPHVTGLAALAVSRGANGPDAVRAALNAAAVKLPGLSANEQGAGLVDAGKLVK